ncbi:jg20694 [Pararge aegeria aegeria]|uniref:Jg20694 protein n=1 Tax=Pararge aegeria aegeria TaxID=348720 RepID=A0A8S4RR91_9NEOP|nr:jg20694 [Pararge aegeria aegeria]
MTTIYVLESVAGASSPELTVIDGEVTIKNFFKCIINNNGNVMNVENDGTKTFVSLETPLFGLITWTCDENYKGETISFFTCGSCGIYCVYNQYISKCQSKILPIVIGLVSGIVISMVILLLCLTIFKRRINVIYAKIIVHFLMRSDRRRVQRIIRYNKATGLNIDVKLKQVKYNNEIIDNIIEENRLKLMRQLCPENKDPIYSEIVYNRSIEYRQANELLERSESRLRMLTELRDNDRYKYIRSRQISKTIVAGLAIASAVPKDTYGCDQMLYIKSNGRICYSGKCYDLSTYSLSLSDGETAFFNDLNNERLSIKLDSIYNIARFSSLYDTSSYTISNEMTWNCLGSGKCWYGSECRNGYKLNVLSKDTKEPHGYGCHMTSVSCVGAMCTHGTSCVWYRWQITPTGPKIPVYSLVSEIWEVKLTVKYKDLVKTILLNTNNPKYDMNNILSEVMNHMPIYITGVNYEKIHLRNSLLGINGTYFNIDSAPHNMPQKGLIGDLQIDKHDTKILFHDNDIDCSVDSCTVKCITNEPALNRLTKTSPYKVDKYNVEHLKMYNDGWINYRYRSSGHGTISFGKVELKELIVEKPHCIIEVGISYACEACNDQPRATFISKNIKTEGMMDYESNCTWDRSSVSCNNGMYDMIQISKNKYCNLYIPLINQSIDITFEYEYRGVLSDMKTIRAETTTDIIGDIISDKTFITTLLTSLSGFMILTGIGTMVIKTFRVGVIAVGRKEIQTA